MVTMQQIDSFGRRIGEEFHPRQVVLFGSYARRTRDGGFRRGRPRGDAVRGPISQQFGGNSAQDESAFSLDLLVRNAGSSAEARSMGDWFLRDILRNGKVLYEVFDS